MKNGSVDYIPLDSCASLSELFLLRVRKCPQQLAYQYFDKDNKRWEKITWLEIFTRMCCWREAFSQENLQAGDRVAVMLPNSPNWVLFEQAALSLGLIVVPLYSNDRPENIAYILKDTKAKLLICPGIAYFEQLIFKLKDVQSLTKIITIDDCKLPEPGSLAVCLSNWLGATGEAASDATTSQTLEDFAPVTCETATIVYTSGTTGPAKGVMLSHSNILSNSSAGLQAMDIYPDDSFLSFLPLSHMLERMAGYYLPMMAGASVTFARSIPDLAEDLVQIQPTVMVAVPRIFEKMYSAISNKVKSGSKLSAKLFDSAVEIGWDHFLYEQKRGPWKLSLLAQPALDQLVGKKVRARLGGKLRIVISGGAALSSDISKFFIGLGLPIYQGYGLTETSPVVCVNRREDNRPEGVGRPVVDIEVKIDETHELLVKGPCVMQGYWNNEKATKAIIDPDGWLHTGDKAVLEDGHVRITGRLKEIIVLSNGEKVAPTDLEMAISLDPLFEHNMVIGEGRPYLTLVCVLNKYNWEELAEKLGVPPIEESLHLPEVKKAIRERIDMQLNGFPGYVFIKDVAMNLSPWSVEDGLLTPTLKMKRKVIERHMAKEIDSMYNR
jgi:long-chain acyl-CoA synthetase